MKKDPRYKVQETNKFQEPEIKFKTLEIDVWSLFVSCVLVLASLHDHPRFHTKYMRMLRPRRHSRRSHKHLPPLQTLQQC